MLSRLLVVLMLASILGCRSGSRFERIEGPVASAPLDNAQGKAKIVVLSPSVHGQSMMYVGFLTHVIKINGAELGVVQANDHVQCLVDPGDVTVWTKGQHVSELIFPVVANQIYYVAAMPRRGRYRANVDLQVMPPSDGARLMGAGADRTRTP